MKPFLIRWLITALAVFVVAHVPLLSIRYDDIFSLFGAALLLGIVNALVRPVLLLLSFPLIIFSLGLFIFVINALMLWMVAGLTPGFHIETFSSALLGSILISVVSWLLSILFKGSDGRVHVLTHHSQVKPVRGRVIR